MAITVGDKVRALRQGLEDWEIPPDCRTFAGKPVYDRGLDFFPASTGLADPARHRISTIVLGTDWASEQTFVEWNHRKRHVAGNTFRQTENLLGKAGFDIADCFLSNAWPVMRAAKPDEGHHPMRDNVEFTNRCREYLRRTLETLDIRLVISLGNACAWFLGPLVGPGWALGNLPSSQRVTIRDLDAEPLLTRDHVVYVNATHPSHFGPNSSRRKLRCGSEIALLVHARRLAGIPDLAGWQTASKVCACEQVGG